MRKRVAWRIGGRDGSQNQRATAMAIFRQEHGAVVSGSIAHQCRCGSVEAAPFRKRLWCVNCGVEKIPVNFCAAVTCAVCSALQVPTTRVEALERKP